jgi:hypothetical protein
MKKYGVYRVFIEDRKIDKWLWGTWEDPHRANEVGLEIRGDGYFTEVIEFEDQDPPKHIYYSAD